MVSGNVLKFPIHNPSLFTAEVNCRVLANSEFSRLLNAAIQALPYIEETRLQEELKQALCEIFLPHAA